MAEIESQPQYEGWTPEERRDAIRAGVEDLKPLFIAAWHQRDWEHFGYDTWLDYLTGEFGGPLRLDRGERQETVAELRMEGMSQPAIGEALGVSQSTVDRDVDELTQMGKLDEPQVITGLDGKERPSTRPTIPDEVIPPSADPDIDVPCYVCNEPILTHDFDENLRPTGGQDAEKYWQFGQGWVLNQGWPTTSNHIKGIRWSDRFVHDRCLDEVLTQYTREDS